MIAGALCVLYSIRNQMRLRLQIVFPRAGVSGAPAAYFQHEKRGICSWPWKYIPRWCLQGVVTFFLFVFMNTECLESRISMNCCLGCERKRGEDSAVLVLHRSGSVILSWEQPQTLVPKQASSLSHRADSRVWLTLDPISLEKRCMKREWSASWRPWGSSWGRGELGWHFNCTGKDGERVWPLVTYFSWSLETDAKKSSWYPLRKSSKCILAIGIYPCLFSPKGKLHLWELLMAHARCLLVAVHG